MSAPAHLTMPALDAMSSDAFLRSLGDLFEHSPWVVAGVAGQRPFHRARPLHDAMMAVVRAAPPDAQLGLIRAHPELAGREAAEGALTEDSQGEQGRLGFTRLRPDEVAELAAVNAAYSARFGFPCIVALSRHATRESAVAAMRARLSADPEAELAAAIGEIGHITEARLAARLGRGGGALSIHALDTVRGGAAPDLAFTFHAAGPDGWRQLADMRTDANGRSGGALLAGLDLEPGSYRIDYRIGDYHRALGSAVTEPAFLEVVSIAFGLADPGVHTHIPIQFTPWAYATYRGS